MDSAWKVTGVDKTKQSLIVLTCDLDTFSTNDNKELENILTEIIPIMHKDSILIIYGIGFNKERMEFWSKVISHPNSGISFDLYDLGILFFDHSKNKQDYIVNF